MKPVLSMEPTEIVQLATFALAQETYAIDIMRIKEIINPLRITRVPKARGRRCRTCGRGRGRR